MIKYLTYGLVLIFFISCTSDNSTNYNDSSNLAKPSDYENIFGVNSDDEDDIDYRVLLGQPGIIGAWNTCVLLVELFAPYLLDTIGSYIVVVPFDPDLQKIIDDRETLIEQSYDFRDDYLSKSSKGNIYINYYENLSEYSIENNIIGEYYKEHLLITPLCVSMAKNLQYGQNGEEIIVDNNSYNELKNIIEIYRRSNPPNNITNILNYLENDLDRFRSMTKSQIDLEFN